MAKGNNYDKKISIFRHAAAIYENGCGIVRGGCPIFVAAHILAHLGGIE
jgi:hypothetical protein